MNDPVPPIMEEPETQLASAGGGARFAATFSLLAPLGAVVIYVFLFAFLRFHGGTSMMVISIFGLLAPLLFLAGFVSGIIALASMKRCGRKGILGKATTGLCVNGLFLTAFVVVLFLPLLMSHPRTPEARLDRAIKILNSASDELHKFYALDDAAKESFVVSKYEDARTYANELLALAPKYTNDWNYGNAIQDGNLVLGRIAVHEGRIDDAKQYLIAAGKGPGSPQMDSFGPNMSLAKDLLEKGERDIVLQYFELCRKFWTMDYGKLNEWSKEVKQGQIPDFGANLVY